MELDLHGRKEVVEGVQEEDVLYRVLYPQVHVNGEKKGLVHCRRINDGWRENLTTRRSSRGRGCLFNELKESTDTDGQPGAARYVENEVVNLVGETFGDSDGMCP